MLPCANKHSNEPEGKKKSTLYQLQLVPLGEDKKKEQ
jgi:hypothetical protein